MEQYIQCGDIAENPLYVKELGIRRSLTFLELSFICRN